MCQIRLSNKRRSLNEKRLVYPRPLRGRTVRSLQRTGNVKLVLFFVSLYQQTWRCQTFFEGYNGLSSIITRSTFLIKNLISFTNCWVMSNSTQWIHPVTKITLAGVLHCSERMAGRSNEKIYILIIWPTLSSEAWLWKDGKQRTKLKSHGNWGSSLKYGTQLSRPLYCKARMTRAFYPPISRQR